MVRGVDVRLVEAVEQDDPVGSGRIQLPRDVAERREEWGNFHGEGNFHQLLQLADGGRQLVLDRRARDAQIGDHLIEVQFQRVGAGLFDDTGEGQPRRTGRAVERRDDRDAHGPLHATDVLGVRVGGERVVVGAGKMREGAGPFGVQRVPLMDAPRAGQRDLLLEQRRDHDRGAPAVLEPLDRVEIEAERRRAGDERMGESKARETKWRCPWLCSSDDLGHRTVRAVSAAWERENGLPEIRQSGRYGS